MHAMLRTGSSIIAVLTVMSVLGGCDAADPVAGAGEREVDADESPLVGTWQRVRADGSIAAEIVFGSDGTFSFSSLADVPDLGRTMTGAFSADEREVVATGVTGAGYDAAFEFSYYVSGTRLAVSADLPVGDHDGLIGTWEGWSHLEEYDAEGEPLAAVGGEMTMTLREDGTGTAHVTAADGSNAFLFVGVWQPYVISADGETEGYEFVGETADREPAHIRFALLDGVALGGAYDYVKIAD